MRCEINERLDRICKTTMRPSTLNALHACRPGHPWNKDNNFCWRNAWSSVQQNRDCVIKIDHRDWDWLKQQADKERESA